MVRTRLAKERQARWKKGQPPHSTIGVARANWIQSHRSRGAHAASGALGSGSIMAITSSGTPSAAARRKRRDMDVYSGSLAAAAGWRDAIAMPQTRHAAGPALASAGCIGHE